MVWEGWPEEGGADLRRLLELLLLSESGISVVLCVLSSLCLLIQLEPLSHGGAAHIQRGPSLLH